MGGNPELYAAAWFYGVNITIFSQEYTNTDGMLIINADGHQGDIDRQIARMVHDSSRKLVTHAQQAGRG